MSFVTKNWNIFISLSKDWTKNWSVLLFV